MVRYANLGRVFTPSVPVERRDSFAGRTAEVLKIIGALSEAGRHVVLYGERGAGKTSLANILNEFVGPLMTVGPTVRINCSTADKL